MQTGTINVQTENIFPIIKKFLYSDHEIFLRELVSNAVDACQKLKTLSSLGESKGELGRLLVEVSFDKDKKTITISDNGIGMTAAEVEKYINQIAFSGAEEFVNKYKDKADAQIIGHFGLGFYSAFMVARKVEILTRSHTDAPAVKWECDGSPNYTLTETIKDNRGTEITLYIAEDSEEFLEEFRLKGILEKYCKFLPVEIKFGEKDSWEKEGEGDDAKDVKKSVENIINNPNPAWTKTPSSLKAEDYSGFYRELYPFSEEPLFNIHLNVDYPFNLTGILYFPKLKETMEIRKNKINLYCNQVFVTDNVEGIVPDFLTLLHGVIDSPDIPLNVSRSYLQSDGNVKKISAHITKKVSDKLEEMFKNDRADFEAKWLDIKVFVEYGMLTEEKFFERINKLALYRNTDGKFYTFEEFTEAIKAIQTDKDNKVIYLYTNEKNHHHALIEQAKERGYQVLDIDGPMAAHLVSKLEQSNENISFARIDSDTIDQLIKRDEVIPSKLSKTEEEQLQPVFESIVSKEKFAVQFASLNETDYPVLITQSEFSRRMREQSAMGGGMSFWGTLPEMYNLVINSNHPLVSQILNEKSEQQQMDLAKQATDLALLANNMLKGEELTNFIKRSLTLIK